MTWLRHVGLALVVRVPQSAIEYIDKARGDGPPTRYVRETLAKGRPEARRPARG